MQYRKRDFSGSTIDRAASSRSRVVLWSEDFARRYCPVEARSEPMLEWRVSVEMQRRHRKTHTPVEQLPRRRHRFHIILAPGTLKLEAVGEFANTAVPRVTQFGDRHDPLR